MTKIEQGAEAIITKTGPIIIKDRIKKSYRHPELDKKIRKRRTRSEIKLLTKAIKLIPTPKIKTFSNKIDFQIEMGYIKGKKLSDHLEYLDFMQICEQIGENIAIIHDAGIIHGDLTTSNMIFVPSSPNPKTSNHQPITTSQLNNKDLSSSNKHLNPTFSTKIKNRTIPNKEKIFFIDYGLGFHSNKIEDKAVDLHLIKQALEAKHSSIFELAFNSILKGYKKSLNSLQVLKQLEKVEKRGRYKSQF